MKKCKNPYCECEQTFPDTVQLCPFCGSALSPEGEDESPPPAAHGGRAAHHAGVCHSTTACNGWRVWAQGTAGPFGGNGAQQSLSQFLS